MGHTLMVAFSDLLVPLFFVGLAGSALVVVVTVIRDVGQTVSRDSKDGSDM